MKFELLVSTMDQKDHHLISKMKIDSDALIINQCNEWKYEEFKYNKNNIRFLSCSEKGIGLSRNTALMRSGADIILFADDDVEYEKDYRNIILSAFEKHPQADVLLFNVPSKNKKRPTFIIKTHKRIRRYNCLRYGAVKMAVRTNKLKKNNITFSLLFGGGARYSAGEDSLFIFDCIRKGLRVYSEPITIGYVNQDESTWFKGYNDKYFYDKGAFFKCLSPRFAYLLGIQYIIRKYKIIKKYKNIKDAIFLIFKGIKEV